MRGVFFFNFGNFEWLHCCCRKQDNYRKQTMKTENLIIGFGKAGKTLAADLGKAGQKTILVEKSDKMYGGSCINVACIPTKFLREQAELGVSFNKAIHNKNVLTEKLRHKNYTKTNEVPNVKIITGAARFIDETTVEITVNNIKKRISAKRIFINTGTVPNIPTIEGVDLKGVYTSTSIMEIKLLPKKIIIVGGGFIGLEFANIFSDFGSEVLIIDSEKKFLEREDEDVSEKMMEIYKKKKIRILSGSQVLKFVKNEKGIKVSFKQNGRNKTTTAEAVLLATGRKPDLKKLEPQNAGIILDNRGFVKVDGQLKTNVKNIWALGDINGGPQFTYISLDDYRIVKNQILKGKYDSQKYRKPFPTTVFTNPPLSHIGKKEKDLKNPEDYIIQKIPAASVPKAMILGETEGFLKAIINKKTKKIEGCTLFCTESQEMINIVKTVMDNNLPYTVLQNQIFTHPSMSEALNDLFTVG